MEISRKCEGIWIPIEIWETKELKMMEKIFLVEIKSLDNKEFEGCFATNAYFAEFIGLSKNRCSEIIKSLERKGFITIRYVRGEHSKNIEKRIINITNAYFDLFREDITHSDARLTLSENRLTPSEKCEDNNIINNKNIYKEEVNKIIDKYNSIEGISKCMKLTSKRKSNINARLKDYGFNRVMDALSKINDSDFLKGCNDRKFKADIDWVFNPNNFVKILEGKYNNRQPKRLDKQKIINNLKEMF